MIEPIVLQVKEVFMSCEKPQRIAIEGKNADKELNQIQIFFKNVDRENMTYEQASMMIVDNVLINPFAFWYFLPKLVYYVLCEDGDSYMLLRQINIMDKKMLTEEQKKCVHKLINKLSEMENEEIV